MGVNHVFRRPSPVLKKWQDLQAMLGARGTTIRQARASATHLMHTIMIIRSGLGSFARADSNQSNSFTGQSRNAYQKKKIPLPPEVEQAVHPEVRRLIQARVKQFPPALRDEVYNTVYVGPYVKYRWTEDKQTYTISLGLHDDYPPFPFVPEGF